MGKRPQVLLVGCLDTKGEEAGYLKACLSEVGVDALLLDAGILGQAKVEADFDRETTAQRGGLPLDQVRSLGHEGKALNVMIKGAVNLALEAADRIDGILGLGGSMGTTLGTAVMREFPVGLPKVMISTMASRDTRPFVGAKDICMVHSVSDLAGLNRVTRKTLRHGALALAGMVKYQGLDQTSSLPLVALSTLGTTEVAAQQLRQLLGGDGFEVVTFHTVGAGGQAMEKMMADGQVDLVLDLSLHELVDHRFGGDYDAGAERGFMAGARGLPQVLVPGNIDFIVTGPEKTAHKLFPGRPCHIHNAAITVVRSSREEALALARVIADMANSSRAPVEVVVPLLGFSAFDHPERGPMPDPEVPILVARELEDRLNPGIPLHQEPYHINDGPFILKLVEIVNRLGEKHD